MVATTEEELLAQEEAMNQPKGSSVLISGSAHKHYGDMFRMWSGWDEGGILFDDPMPYSQWAHTDLDSHTVILDPDMLILNPNRLLLTITPYRMKQEAVLTGTLLHEAGHARFSKWIPQNAQQVGKFKHSRAHKQVPVTKQTLALARLMEEPRVEGHMARNAMKFGATGLAWTMRAAAAHLVPFTRISEDPNQAVMDVISSWAQRAGRHLALNQWQTSHFLNQWVTDMSAMCEQTIQEHLFRAQANGAQCSPMVDSQRIMGHLTTMLTSEDHSGKTMIDEAKSALDLLYPEQDGDDQNAPSPSGGCKSMPQEDDSQGQSQGQPSPDQQKMQDALSQMEQQADSDTSQSEAEAKAEAEAGKDDESKKQADQQGDAGGHGKPEKIKGEFRMPNAEEREIERGAQRFLRSLIDPTTTSKVSLSASPSAAIDGAALAAWKAAGQVGSPRFFKRVKKTRTAAPPVKVAILVDVSSSMDSLQKPSALLSWALASAATDLRNFAGRGVQVESTLIHWGDRAEVIQANGQLIPGIREVECRQGTSAMHVAFDLIDQQIPGFFEEPVEGKPASRLIVQFTDWMLAGYCAQYMGPLMDKALSNGVNHLTVFPDSYSMQRGSLGQITQHVKNPRGRNEALLYNPSQPGAVWSAATKALEVSGNEPTDA